MAKDEDRLARRFLERGGYVRTPNAGRRERLGSDWHRTYKKGWEARFPAHDADDAAQVVDQLSRVGIRAGRLFRKGSAMCVPVYGRPQVERILAMVDRLEE